MGNYDINALGENNSIKSYYHLITKSHNKDIPTEDV